MKFRLYKDVHEFYKDTYDVLMRHEEQNILPLVISLLDMKERINHSGGTQQIG